MITRNKSKKLKVLSGMTAGLLLGFLYWMQFGICYGILPLSSECWVNCVYGSLVGGWVGSAVSS